MLVTFMPSMAFAENQQLVNGTEIGNATPEESDSKNYVTVKGIKDLESQTFSTMDQAYDAGNKVLSENGGLEQDGLSDEKFKEVFTDNGNITWTVYGNAEISQINKPYFLTFGRKAKHYGQNHIETVTLQGGSGDRVKDQITFKTDITPSYEWWGEDKPNNLVIKNLTMDIDTESHNLHFNQAYNDGLDLTVNNCIIKGGMHIFNNSKNNYTITNNQFNGTGKKCSYALHLQGHVNQGTEHESLTTNGNIIGNTIFGYARGINLDQYTGTFTVRENTITPGKGYSAVQVSRCSKAIIENNDIKISESGDVLTIHESFAKYKSDAEITVSGNRISAENGAQGYFVYDDVKANNFTYGEENNQANVTLIWENNNISGNFDSKHGIKGEKVFELSEYIESVLNPPIVEPDIPPYIPPASDNVTNDTDDKTTNADIDATVNADGKAEATVDQTTADKIVDKAVANGSTEITIDATTSAGKADAAEVKLPAETVSQLVEKTDADIIVKTDAAEVKLDQEAAKAITETASAGTVSIIVEKTKDESAEMRFELKVVTENGAVSDLKGGTAAVTVKLNDSLKDKELVCVYIDENGRYYKVKGEKDVLKGIFTFFTDHFSTYAIMEAEAAEQIIEEQTNARLKAGVENTTIKLYYNKKEIGKGWIKLRYKKSYGYKVDNYEIFRSAKKKTNFGDEAWFVTKTNKTKGFYKNSKSVKKGTRYYYKMRGVREIAGETVYTQWSNIVMRTGR